MPVQLPSDPAPRRMTPRLISHGGDLRPSLGGAVQRIGRVGSRFAVEFEFPPMKAELGRPFVSRLLRCERDTARMSLRQPGLVIGNPGGDVQVDGAGQAGSRLALRNMTPGYAVRDGQFFHLFVAERHYLHMVTAGAVASPLGKVLLDIAPMLRIRPADGAHANFTDVTVGGWIQGRETPWTIELGEIFGLGFTIEEAA